MQRLSRDPAVVQAIKADPWRMPKGTVLGLHDMISKVYTLLVGIGCQMRPNNFIQSEELLDHHAYGRWPSDLPVCFLYIYPFCNFAQATSPAFDDMGYKRRGKSNFEWKNVL